MHLSLSPWMVFCPKRNPLKQHAVPSNPKPGAFRWIRFLGGCLLIGTIGVPLASAVIPEDPVETLPAMIVRGTALPAETVHDPVTGTTGIMLQEDWTRVGAGDLASALRRVPGVTISRYNRVGSYGGADGGAVFIRGHGSSRPGGEIATLFDGVPRVVGVWTHPLLDTLAIDAASSIAVHKHPQPVLLGNMAFGAINLVPAKQSVGDPNLRFRSSYGNHDTSLLMAQAGFAREGFDLLGTFSHRRSKGHRPNASGDILSGVIHAGWQVAPAWSVRYLAQRSHSRADDPEPVGRSLPIVERYETSQFFHLIKIEHQSVFMDLELKAYQEQGIARWMQWHQPPPPPFPAQSLTTRTDTLNSGIHLNMSAPQAAVWDWKTGIHFDQPGGKVHEDYAIAPDQRFGSQRFELLAPWAHLTRSWQAAEDHTLIASMGARYFRHAQFADEFGYQGSMTWKHQTVSVSLHHAQSVNYPGVFVSVFGRRPAPWNVGEQWRDLHAEMVQAWELGFSWEPAPGVSLHLSGFHHEASRSLRLVAPPPAGYILNLGDYTLRGAELAIRAQATDSLHLALGITRMESDPLRPNTPTWNLQAGAVWNPAPRWEISLGMQHVSRQQVINPRWGELPVSVAGFTLVDASLSYLLSRHAGHSRIFAHVENLTNTNYEYRPGYPMPGISFALGLDWRW
jgi:outer membrane receptor protein involved in Fe transport